MESYEKWLWNLEAMSAHKYLCCLRRRGLKVEAYSRKQRLDILHMGAQRWCEEIVGYPLQLLLKLGHRHEKRRIGGR